MGFWKNVERELLFQGLSRKDLSYRAGISYSSIGNGIERDSIPQADTAVKIANVLGKPLEFLLREHTKKTARKFFVSEIPNENSLNEKILEALNELSPEVRASVCNLIFSLANRNDEVIYKIENKTGERL